MAHNGRRFIIFADYLNDMVIINVMHLPLIAVGLSIIMNLISVPLVYYIFYVPNDFISFSENYRNGSSKVKNGFHRSSCYVYFYVN